MDKELFQNALTKYRRELSEYNRNYLEYVAIDLSSATDEILILKALEEAAQRLQQQNEKHRKGWKRQNDGQQNSDRKKDDTWLR